MATKFVHLNHDPVVLRVFEMVDGEVGKVARQVGEIALARGRNEVDADLWAKWLKQNEGGPLAACLHQEEPEKRDDETEDKR
jgi:hypothetical protein